LEEFEKSRSEGSNELLNGYYRSKKKDTSRMLRGLWFLSLCNALKTKEIQDEVWRDEMAGCEFGIPSDGWENTGVAVGPLGLVEWTTLDAQFFGLAQRRNRVFLVRDSGDWANRPPVLFEREGLLGAR
jgi:DNA (cytosine-5)-methyltransferase 1